MTPKSYGCAALLLLLAGFIYLSFVHPLAMGLAVAAVVLIGLWRVSVFTANLRRAVREVAEATGEERRTPRASRQGGRFWRSAGSADPEGLGGLLYVGHGLMSVAGQMPEPALIDHNLPIDSRITECTSDRLERWPSYATCSPEARAAYLTWLSTGRNNPRADIGYVFLYFYGLERRALHDMVRDPAAAAERPALITELERLLSIYGGNTSFCRYASSLRMLLVALELPTGSYQQPPSAPLSAPPGEPLTPSDWVALGMCAADGAPVPAARAYRWVLQDSGHASGVVAQRAPAELEALFGEIYRSRYGEGLVLSAGRVKLRLTHRPASPSFLQEVRIATAFPDVSRQQRAREQLEAVVSEARDRLARYSRKVGKDPSAAGTAEGLLELPVSLWPAPQRRPLEELAQRVTEAGEPLELPFAQLRAVLPQCASLTRSSHHALCEVMAGLCLGMEPDPGFGGPVPGDDAHVVLFADDPGSRTSRASTRYLGVAAMLELAVAVASADGQSGDAEREVMLARVRAFQGLTQSERRRCGALLQRLSREPPRPAGLKRRLAALDARGREMVGEFLVEVAAADRTITPREIRLLQSSFTLLGLDAEGVFAKVHAAEVSGQPPGSAQAVTPEVTLDAAKVARLQADSEAVAALLGSVFTSDSEEEPQAAVSASRVEQADEHSGKVAGVLGLDAAAVRFLKRLLEKSGWSRAELAALARDSGVPLDGVLERLNEAAYDKLDMPLFEDGDPLVLNPEAVAAVTAAMAV